MKNKTYEALLWISQIFLPAFITLAAAIFEIWNIPYGVPIVATLTAVDAFLGALLMKKRTTYHKQQNAVDEPTDDILEGQENDC